jgi:hypothetical protein
MGSKLAKILFVILLAAWIVTYFTQDDYRDVQEIDPAVLKPPVQLDTTNKTHIKFTSKGYEYDLKPLYWYEINGLLVHRLNYKKFSIYSYADVFQEDLCLLWGSNVSGGIYQSPKLSFSQDGRFAYYQWTGNLNFNPTEISNNHLLINSKVLEKKLKALNNGDQVKITGLLVDVVARNIGATGVDKVGGYSWQTSTIRTDTGAGACEIIYVGDIEILQKGNPLSVNIHLFSFYGIIILLILYIVKFVGSA